MSSNNNPEQLMTNHRRKVVCSVPNMLDTHKANNVQ